jgi:hypothetical protein
LSFLGFDVDLSKYPIQQEAVGFVSFQCGLLAIRSFPIGTIDSADAAQLDNVRRSYDGQLNNTPNLNCGTWLLTIVEKLVEQSPVQCSGV